MAFTQIKLAQQQQSDAIAVVESLASLQILPENVTHVLANIAMTAQKGGALKIMHLNSVSAFMAGVEVIAQQLGASQDERKVANTIRVLSAAGIGSDGLVTTDVAPIAQMGARHRDIHAKYAGIVKQYSDSVDTGKPDGKALTSAARQLQTSIDQAVRVSKATPVKPMAKGVANSA